MRILLPAVNQIRYHQPHAALPQWRGPELAVPEPVAASHARGNPTASDARTVMRQYQQALMTLPGVTSIGWSAAAPNEISVHIATSELRYLAQRVVAPQIGNVSLRIWSSDQSGEPAPTSWVRVPSNIVRIISALPGIVGWTRFGGFTVFADSRERIEWLRPLLPATVEGTPLRLMLETDMPLGSRATP